MISRRWQNAIKIDGKRYSKGKGIRKAQEIIKSRMSE